MIELSLKNSKILIQSRIIEELEKYLNYNKVLIITDDKVYKLYKDKMQFKNAKIFVVKNGEKSKNFDNYKKIIKKGLEFGLDRKSAIVAFGGGVVGDLAGFVASTLFRGISFIQIPTTLIAQVDSAIGGKNGIDTKFGKNLVGTFYQANLILIDPSFLNTLNQKDFNSALGEVLKYAFIEKSCKASEYYDFWGFLNKYRVLIFKRESQVIENMIKICCMLKISVVEKDEKENNLRKILNFGHTFGHAIEKITNYRKFSHGQAVAIGIKMAFEKALKENNLEKAYFDAAIKLLDDFELNNKSFQNKKIEQIMSFDKKTENGIVHFIMPVKSQC